jgi:hypothetical protein
VFLKSRVVCGFVQEVPHGFNVAIRHAGKKTLIRSAKVVGQSPGRVPWVRNCAPYSVSRIPKQPSHHR